jgi:hypothetical protein
VEIEGDVRAEAEMKGSPFAFGLVTLCPAEKVDETGSYCVRMRRSMEWVVELHVRPEVLYSSPHP